ncbi:MAG: RNA polymerase factor sigma-54 [Rhizobiaceae bacterium]|nr:RNA polymerase factor sigma-54 [Rhizobiaceae bacterium]
MAIAPSLQQKQSQSLVMTPKLAQSIKLLQLSHVDLMSFVQEEVEKNPLLEISRDDGKDRRGDGIQNSGTAEANESGNPDAHDAVKDHLGLDAGEKVSEIDANLENVYDGGTAGAERQPSNTASTSSGSTSSTHTSGDEEFDAIAHLRENLSLAQHLELQIGVTFKNPTRQKIATYIAHALDDDGYFREDLAETAQRLNVSVDEVLGVLSKFQTMDPVGIGARNLEECLAIQLKELDRFDPAMEIFVANLDLLAKREFEQLKRLCGVTTEDFNDMIREVKALDPRPALRHDPVLAEAVVPDVLIGQRADGTWSIELNPETLPRVLVDHRYHAELERAVSTDEGKSFVNECMTNANWLTKSLDQRAQTILKVAVEIVKQQDMFFAHGVEHLKPMNLKMVAEKIKMHESTVSRVTANKYLMCDQGIFELKFFFSSAISANDGEESHSAETVKHKIRQLIDAEEPKKILSDDKLVALLQETGIEIARRTVAKYREAMRIPSSVQRRREKAMILEDKAS